jgi:hypothetical protein
LQYLLLIYGEDDEWDSTATTVQVRNGDTVVRDGPAGEAHEQLGGFCVIDAESLDEAIALAERITAAESGTIEIRPVRDNSEHRA